MEQKHGLYIGITGFTNKDNVSSALGSLPAKPSRLLMVGVIATWKSLRGIPLRPEWQKQTPPPEKIEELFPNDKRVLNLVHYSTEKGQEGVMLKDMLNIHQSWPALICMVSKLTSLGRKFANWTNTGWPKVTRAVWFCKSAKSAWKVPIMTRGK